MDGISSVNIFIPTKLFVSPNGLLFGYHRVDKRSLNVNITAMTSRRLLAKLGSGGRQLSQSLATAADTTTSTTDDGTDIHMLGTIDSADIGAANGTDISGGGGGHRLTADDNGLNGDRKSGSGGHEFWCELHFTDNQLSLRCCLIDGHPIDDGVVTLIHYDTRDFMSSQLFGKEDDCDNRMAFVEFIIDSLKRTSNLFRTQLSGADTITPSNPSADSSAIPIGDRLATAYECGDLRLMLPRRLTASFIEFQHNAHRRRRRTKTHVRNKSWFPNQRQITGGLVDTV
ncbi:unnamed protein product, partial [Medioppia subpectinata]